MSTPWPAGSTSMPRRTPELGFKKLDTYRTPVIGPRLHRRRRRRSAAGGADDRLAQRDLPGQDDAGRRGPDPGVGRAGAGRPARRGCELAVTGSAVVGHDINTAANESIANTTWTTVILVVVILLIVYRSPLLAMVPLVTIALSVIVSLRSIALLTTVPGSASRSSTSRRSSSWSSSSGRGRTTACS